jgi:hypothetical protein
MVKNLVFRRAAARKAKVRRTKAKMRIEASEHSTLALPA